MNNIFRTIILFSVFYYGISNSVIAQPEVEFNCICNFIEVDDFGNIYAVDQAELKKYNPNGKLLYRYSNQINSNITSVDVTNPLRIVLFHKESNVVTFLNRQLAQISSPINIYDATEFEAAVVGASSEGGFWMYSVDIQSIMLFDSQLKKVQESQNLSGWLNNSDVSFIREKNQKVYLGIAQKVLIFDMFGSYITTIHFADAKHLKFGLGQISYSKKSRFFVYNLLLKNEIEKAVPVVEGFKKLFYFNNHFYVITNGMLSIF